MRHDETTGRFAYPEPDRKPFRFDFLAVRVRGQQHCEINWMPGRIIGCVYGAVLNEAISLEESDGNETRAQ